MEGDTSVSIKNDPIFGDFAGKKNVVLYGIGNVGKKLFNRLSSYNDFQFLAVCDNSCVIDFYEGIPVYTHEKCVSLYKDAIYLVTPQSGYIQIILRLLDDDVKLEHILFFNNQKQCIEKK